LAQIAGTVSGAGREIRGHNPATSSSWTQHRGKKSRSELEVLAQRYGWQPREFTLAELHRMSTDEILYREAFDKEHLQAAYDEPNRKEDQSKKLYRDIWKGKASKELTHAAFEATKTFSSRFPQYVPVDENHVKIQNYVFDNNLDPTKPESYEQAFRTLGASGELILSPAAIGIGKEEEIGGEKARNYSRDLLKPESELKREKRLAEQKRVHDLTSDQFKKENQHAWLDVDGIPKKLEKLPDNARGAVLGRMEHIFAEWAEQEPRWTHTQANRESLLQYLAANNFNYSVQDLNRAFLEMSAKGLLTVGQPVFDKAAFRREIAGMSSDEYRRRYTDSVFRMKADSL